MQHVVIIGAGMGGLTAAIRLAQGGCRVTVVEARAEPGGLAAHVDIGSMRFDAGPYILLDRPGLIWAFRQLRIDVAQLSLQRVERVYETDVAGRLMRVSASLDETAAGIESHWPGSGQRYREFIAQMQTRYSRLQPLQCLARPSTRRRRTRTRSW